ncbi:MAG: hypothetical protein KIT22_01430 [Verrucomicrobiae bacterium]|nr:hypothetical protein [Verrucomicrobiae bacterium]
MRDSGHFVASETLVAGFRDDQHQPGKPGRPGLRRDAHDTGFVHWNRQRFHAPNLFLSKTD